MCECGRLFSSALLTAHALVIMSGEVKGVSVDCDRDVTSGCKLSAVFIALQW